MIEQPRAVVGIRYMIAVHITVVMEKHTRKLLMKTPVVVMRVTIKILTSVVKEVLKKMKTEKSSAVRTKRTTSQEKCVAKAKFTRAKDGNAAERSRTMRNTKDVVKTHMSTTVQVNIAVVMR